MRRHKVDAVVAGEGMEMALNASIEKRDDCFVFHAVILIDRSERERRMSY